MTHKAQFTACGVCLGEPLPSGKPCICGGIGTEQAEMHGLRSALFHADDEIDRLRAKHARLREALKNIAYIGPAHGSLAAYIVRIAREALEVNDDT